MYAEEELLPVSGLQHMVYCERQAALIHVDRIWADNAFTVEGSHLHRVVDEEGEFERGGIRLLRGVALRSLRLGLVGKADVVELHPAREGERAVAVSGLGATEWHPVPVEYKRGRPKAHRADEVQLCAQAICLEEHFEVRLEKGFLYYGQQRRRTEVPLGEELRRHTEEVALAFHELVRSQAIPVRTRDARCDRCSLLDVCMPPKRGRTTSPRRFLRDWVRAHISEGSHG